jgi:hypothetical protein
MAIWVIGIGISPKAGTVAPAFLPPTYAHTDHSNLPANVKRLVEAKPPIVGTHGWFGYFVNGIHVYSLDMVLSLAKALKDGFPQSCIYTVVSGLYDWKHREFILSERGQLQLEKIWLVVEEPFHAVALYCRSTAAHNTVEIA